MNTRYGIWNKAEKMFWRKEMCRASFKTRAEAAAEIDRLNEYLFRGKSLTVRTFEANAEEALWKKVAPAPSGPKRNYTKRAVLGSGCALFPFLYIESVYRRGRGTAGSQGWPKQKKFFCS